MRVGLERAIGKIDVAHAQISEATRCVTQGEQRLTGHVRDVNHGVRTVASDVITSLRKLDGVEFRVREVGTQVKHLQEMTKRDQEALRRSLEAFMSATTAQQQQQAKTSIMDHVAKFGLKAVAGVADKLLFGIPTALFNFLDGIGSGSNGGVNIHNYNTAGHQGRRESPSLDPVPSR